jgi:hypothetical protein
MLLLATILISLMVVTMNRLVWRRLYRLAETRYKLEGLTTAYQGWAGVSNGELLRAAEDAGFDVLMTADQGLNYQQNLKGFKLAIVVLSTNKNSRLIQGTSLIANAIDSAQPGSFTFLNLGSEPATI